MRNNLLKRFDFFTFFLSIALSTFGLATLFTLGGDNAIFYKQLIFISIGIVVCLGLFFIDLSNLKQNNSLFYFYIVTIITLIVLVLVGYVSNGAKSWFRIGSFSLQPVEFAKLAIIGILTKYFYKRHVYITVLRTLIISFLYVAILFILVLLQPDFGSALVILGIWGFIVLVSGIPKKFIFGLATLVVLIFAISWQFVFATYQKERIINFIYPMQDIRNSGYNVYQSIVAIGSGGTYGKGIALGTQSRLAYLPEYETDFIFAAFAEEWGFVGAILCVMSFMLLIIILFYKASQSQTDFEMLFCVGIAAFFFIHFIVNVGMNMGVMPVTGIPLPFMSLGGTHILVEYIMLGIILSFDKNKKRIIREVDNKEIFVV